MDLEARLRAFAAVARKRSFSAAARELRISQPAISKHVADIERLLGGRLVERRARGGELTAAGAFLADYVLRAEALLAQAARSVTEFHLPPTGSLTIAASGVPATYLIPEVAVAFQRAYPGVQVSIVPAPSAQTMDALRAHRAEFAVVGGFAAAPEIEAEPLVEEDIVVVGPPRYARRRLSRRDAEAATLDRAAAGFCVPGGSGGRVGRPRDHARPAAPAADAGGPEAGGGSRRRRSRLQPVRRRGRAPSWLAGAPEHPRLELAPYHLYRPPSGYRAHTVRARVRGAAEGALEPAAYAQACSSSPNRGASARYFRLTRSIMRRLI